ncbi:MAG: hypothetical protein LBR25_08530 [Erysipelotrichaceae bacterium]|nr:hypothetical protein [Erysipelotrichaceae bacterium]
MNKKAFVSIWLWLVFCLLLNLYLFVWGSGFVNRDYQVYEAQDVIRVGNLQLPALEAAKLYVPELSRGEFTAPQAVYTEVREGKDAGTIEIIYRYQWPDESHPNFLIDFFYRIYRSAMYGSPKDIESVLMVVDVNDGRAIELYYEAPIIKGNTVEHQLVQLRLENDGWVDEDGTVLFPKYWKPALEVTSWNHLFTAVETIDHPENRGPQYLSSKHYQSLFMARRSMPGDTGNGSKYQFSLGFWIGGVVVIALEAFVAYRLLLRSATKLKKQ